MLGVGPASGEMILVYFCLSLAFWSWVHTFGPRWNPDVGLHEKVCKAKLLLLKSPFCHKYLPKHIDVKNRLCIYTVLAYREDPDVLFFWSTSCRNQ